MHLGLGRKHFSRCELSSWRLITMKNKKKKAAEGLLAQKKQGGRTRALFNTGTRPMEDKSKYSRRQKHCSRIEEDAFFLSGHLSRAF